MNQIFEIVAHRGDPSVAVENSMEAFEAAILAGAKRIELDVWHSKDGEFFILHDESLVRSCGHNDLVGVLNANEIDLLRLKNGEALPRLTDVLVKIGTRIELNIEVKFGAKRWVSLLLETVHSLGEEHSLEPIIWSSFHISILEEIRSIDSLQNLAVLCGPDSSNSQIKKLAKQLDQLDAHTAHPWHGFCDPSLMKELSGKKVVPYCGYIEEKGLKQIMWQRLFDLGVDGHCTNFPGELRAWLNSK